MGLGHFHGTFEHTLDAKNRLTVPSKFRSTLAGTVFLVKGAEPCLSVYPGGDVRRDGAGRARRA